MTKHFGIPDPGGVSGTFAALERTKPTSSPFDTIRNVTPEGREYWSARDLMPLLDYEKWERFADAIGRAKIAAHNSGYDVAQNFPAAGKVSGQRGPDQADYHLSRYACYLVAMSGDSRKEAVARALTYFAVKTRQAEVSAPRELSDDEKIDEALQISARRIHELKVRVAELEPPAAAWQELADAAGDYSVADAAKVLSRDPNIVTGERRLFTEMARKSWIYRSAGRWRAYQVMVDNGRLVEKINRPYVNSAGEAVAPAPTIRVTPKGIEALQKLLGGGSGQLALAVAE